MHGGLDLSVCSGYGVVLRNQHEPFGFDEQPARAFVDVANPASRQDRGLFSICPECLN